MNRSGEVRLATGLAGAILGGAAGWFLFWLLTQFGLLALALPGAGVGLGCGYLSGGRSLALGTVCGVMSLLLGVIAEWFRAPFAADGSLLFFIRNLGDLPAGTQIMLVVGLLLGAWLGTGRAR